MPHITTTSEPFWRRIGPLALMIDTVTLWLDKRATSKGAALALYMMFSLAPILVLIVALSGWFFSAEEIREEILRWMNQLVGPRGADVVNTVMSNAHYAGNSRVATLVSLAVILFSSTTAFAELKTSLDDIWDATPERGGVIHTVKSRLIAFTVLLALAVFLTFTLIAEGALALLREHWPIDHMGQYPAWLDSQLPSLTISLLAFIMLFAAVLKMLPAVHLRWRDVLPGAMFTALLFLIGKAAIGMYLGSGTLLTAYGAAGSLVALLATIYFSALIFYFGAAFTRCFYERYIQPAETTKPLF